MKPIIPPIHPDDQGPEVANLQQGLQLLLRRELIAVEPGLREQILRELTSEQQEQRYRGATKELVSLFQRSRHIPPDGDVGDDTAKALTAALREIGALDIELTPQGYVVSGAVRGEDGRFVRGVRVRAFHASDGGAIRLGEDMTDAEGRYTIQYEAPPGTESVSLQVTVSGDDGEPWARSPIVPNARIQERVDLTMPGQAPQQSEWRIEGVIVLDDGRPAEGLKLRFYRRGFGDQTIQLGDAETREGGRYAFAYDGEGRGISLEVRAVDATGAEIVLSDPLNDLGPSAEVNLVAPASLMPLAAEYHRLHQDLLPHIGNMAKLAEVKENTTQQDLTILNRATGWDARLIALASISERLASDPDIGLPSDALYGLLRAGLPSDKRLLAQVEPEVIEQALTMVRDAGIVTLDDETIANTRKIFAEARDKIRLNLQIPGSRSTYGALLKTSGLDEAAQKSFASIYLNHRGDAEQMWAKARDEAGLDRKQIHALQLQGKLAFLTGNSEGMTRRLLLEKQVSDPLHLVDQGFYRAEAWKSEILSQAGIPSERWGALNADDKAKLDTLIPSAYARASTEDSVSDYAEDMARKLRVSYPTQVLFHRIENDDAYKPLAGDENTIKLLRDMTVQGFQLGQTPVDAFLALRADVVADPDVKEFAIAKQQIRALHRLYQISPSDEAMPVLMNMGITSAHDVVAYSSREFTERYVSAYEKIYGKQPQPTEGDWILRKSNQVSSVVYNLFTVAARMHSDLSVAGLSGSAEQKERVLNGLVKQFPTMESLFGSMDYCECEHCRSVLSPAAYLVDLLQSLEEWGEDWGKTRTYPNTFDLPYKALTDKRPDIPYIALTCENTNTALPYIDVVNEILEYYVDKGNLSEQAAHDTGTATTDELLAEPQNVIGAAYDKLRKERYPLGLPFDLWIETVRQFCDYFETPLHQLLETFRSSDKLFETGGRIDHAMVFMESLGMSPAEVEILTDPDPLSHWHDLYGHPTASPVIQDPGTEVRGGTQFATLTVADEEAAALEVGTLWTYQSVDAPAVHDEAKIIASVGNPGSGGAGRTRVTFEGTWKSPPQPGDRLVYGALANLRSAKTLSRRLGVSYKEITEIVLGSFVNPGLAALGVLHKLGISVRDARLYKDHKAFYEQNADLVGKDRATLSATDQQRFDVLGAAIGGTPFSGWEIVNELAALEQKIGALASRGIAVDDLRARIQSIAFDKTLVLADPDTGCSFDKTTLQYADGTAATPIDFLRINLFVRLWRKLGWSIEEADRALSVFIPDTVRAGGDAAALTKWLKTALIYLAHLKTLDDKIKIGKQSRLKLLTLWSNIATTGKQPLYAQLFLGAGMLKADPVFDHPLSNYLELSWIEAAAQSRWYTAELEADEKIDPTPFDEETIRLAYDDVRKVQQLSIRGVVNDAQKAALNLKLPNSKIWTALLDSVQGQGQAFSLIRGHMPALQGALGLVAGDIERILDAESNLDKSKLPFEKSPLSIETVSVLYRYALLARGMKLSVSELITLIQLSGINPFHSLHDAPLEQLDQDHPYSATLELVRIADEVRGSGLKIEDLDYLLRHRFDKTEKYRIDRDGTLVFLKSLSEGIRAIRAEHVLPDSPDALSEEVLRQKLGLALQPDVAERVLGMINTTAEFTFTKKGVKPEEQLGLEALAIDERIREVSYKEIPHKEQKVTVRGVLFDSARDTMQAGFNAKVTEKAQQQVFEELLKGTQALARTFFDSHLEKQDLGEGHDAGFLKSTDFDTLFAALEPMHEILASDSSTEVDFKRGENEKIEKRNQEELHNRRYRLAQAFLPFLQERLIRQFVVQTLVTRMSTDPLLVESFVTDERLLAAPTPLAAIAAVSGYGVDVTFSAVANGAETVLSTMQLADADTGARDRMSNPLKPAGADSAQMEAYLEVPATGAYRFYIELDRQNAKAELRFRHLSEPMLVKGTASADRATLGNQPNEYLELTAGLLYHFSLDLTDLNGGDARIKIQGERLPKGPLSQVVLYRAAVMDDAEHRITLLDKALMLVQSLGLSEREIRYLLTNSADFDNLSLSNLLAINIINADADVTSAADRFHQLRRLMAYARLKRDLAGGTADLIDIFEFNKTTSKDRLEKQIYPRIARLAHRDEATVKASAEILVGDSAAPTLESEKPLSRLWEVLQIVERFGVAPASLQNWTTIAGSSTVSARRFEIARNVKETIKARFEPAAWQRVAQPIFDKLRQRQRDALVAYVMHLRHFERIEQLYEYFLIDPGMEPVVQTSRIRLAIASVQLFVQRCLLNLEPRVHPAAINAGQWEWMKRYRVWEANRKIFLFPENWLEPEFRDDKTHLFSELEGALLQGDVSSDLVEDAFLAYLRKLDELARLDIVAMHVEEDAENATHRVLHVFGRTFSQPHKYFYRRYSRQMWTPWEPVSAEIEGDHLAPVAWRDRLYLFWVTFLEKADSPSVTAAYAAVQQTQELVQQALGAAKNKLADASISDITGSLLASAGRRTVQAQLHWSEYLQGQWTTCESNGFDAPSPIEKPGLTNFDAKEVFVHVSKEYDPTDGAELGVYIHLGGAIESAFYLAGRNSAPEKEIYEAPPENPFASAGEKRANRYAGDGSFQVSYHKNITNDPADHSQEVTPDILGSGGKYLLLPCNNNLRALRVSADATAGAERPAEVKAAIERGLREIGSLMKPVFYQDNRHTLFVEPTVTESTVERWKEWVPSPAKPGRRSPGPVWHPIIVDVVFEKPHAGWQPPDNHSNALIGLKSQHDLLINPSTTLQFDGALVGPRGRVQVEIQSNVGSMNVVTGAERLIDISSGSSVARNSVVVGNADAITQAGLKMGVNGLNVVGAAGLNPVLVQNIAQPDGLKVNRNNLGGLS